MKASHMINKVILTYDKFTTGFSRRYYSILSKAKLQGHNNAIIGTNINFYGKSIIKIGPKAKIKIGDNFVCRSGSEYGVGVRQSKIQVADGATLTIGDNTGISNTNIACMKSISIGNNVNIGFETTIIDSDFHSISIADRLNHTDTANAKHRDVIIHDNVFIGARCLILKGVEIGENAVVAAGSVVATDIPANELWGGVLAKYIKSL